jgi:hypothetical protein
LAFIFNGFVIFHGQFMAQNNFHATALLPLSSSRSLFERRGIVWPARMDLATAVGHGRISPMGTSIFQPLA